MAGYNSYAAQRRIGTSGAPPDRGSFPLDHWNDCTFLKDDYLSCLRRNKMDNLSCRYLTKQYLQCRMEHNLMSQEDLPSLGFRENAQEVEREPRSQESDAQRRQRDGYMPGYNALVLEDRDKWRILRIFSMPDVTTARQWLQAMFLLEPERRDKELSSGKPKT
ncbi:unnamed protein product [Amoebophrya sp. A120]|nr:unnamed protein product [Amoebophrya sp. A120]|eukprot:GSA120T00012211001.1